MKLELEIVKFNTADIVVTSGGACGDQDNTIDVPCGGPLD
jgi:hypothetical protein